jgi:hypothetical protein
LVGVGVKEVGVLIRVGMRVALEVEGVELKSGR